MQRRDLLRLGGLAAAAGGATLASLSGCAAPATGGTAARVLVVGGGFGGITAARQLRRLSGGRIDVQLVEPDAAFVSCPLSNLVVAGMRGIAEITRPYDGLAAHGVQVVRDRVVRIDAAQRVAVLGAGATLRYDRLVLSPGVEMIWDEIAGLREARHTGRILQAWKAGAETTALRAQLEAMPDGGVFAIAIPEVPYRCPPAPYERASLVAAWFKVAKPRSKVLVVDANDDIASDAALFRKAWAETYPGLIEYRPQHKVVGVDAVSGTLRFEIQDDVRADVLNVLPPMRAGRVAVATGLANSNARWCSVRWLDFESTAAPHIHVIGDAIQVASLMARSGQMAHSQGRVVAAALVAELDGRAPDAAALLTNACYSFVDARRAIRVASTHAYSSTEQTWLPVPGTSTHSTAPGEAEADGAWRWARSIWAEMLD